MRKKLLARSKVDLLILKDYLARQHNILCDKITLKHDHRCDLENSRKSRAFAWTQQGSGVIHAAAILDDVEPDLRYGIILHEIAHIYLDAFGRNAEIRVDEWIAETIPESGYEYKNCVYRVQVDGHILRRSAMAVEHVSNDFLRKLK